MTNAIAPPPPAPATPPAERVRTAPPAGGAAFAAAVAAHVVVALSLRHFPYQDVPNHLARYALIARAVAGAAPAWVDVRLVPTGYIALDLVGAFLLTAFGAAATAKLFALAGAVALPLGMRRLLDAVAPAQRGWAVVGALLAFSAYYLSGFLNYVIGVGAVLAWLAAWWPRRGGARARAVAGLAAGVVGLFLLHLAAPLVALAVVGFELLWAAGSRPWAAEHRAAVVPRVAILGACAVTLAAVLAVTSGAVGHPPPIRNPVPVPPGPDIVFRTPARKLLALAWPFYGLSLFQGAVLGVAYAGALALYLRDNGRAALRHPLGLASLGLLGIYLVWPLAIGEARAVDARWLLPAYALIFCAGSGGRAPSPRVLAAVAAGAVVHAAVVFAAGRAIDRDLDAYDRVLARIPATARVMPFVTPVGRHGARIEPYRHHAMWHVVRGPGRVAGLFAADGLLDDGRPWSHMAHVRERDRLYYPVEGWGRDSTPALPWDRIWRDFDVVVHAGDDDPRADAELNAHARPLFRDGDVTLFGPPASLGARSARP